MSTSPNPLLHHHRATTKIVNGNWCLMTNTKLVFENNPVYIQAISLIMVMEHDARCLSNCSLSKGRMVFDI